jgi:molecular chaperone Hsp33
MNNRDVLIHGMLLNQTIRFAAIEGTKLVSDAKELHGLSRVATAALGRQLMITVIAASLCKNDSDTVSTVIAGNGPAGNLVCVGRNERLVKGYVTNPDVELPIRADGKLDVGGYVGSAGKLTLIRDLGLKEPYVGTCRLVSGEIAEDFAQYFTVSEQQPSIVYLGVHETAETGKVTGAGGLLIQTMPNCPDESIEKVMSVADRIPVLGAELSKGKTLRSVLDEVFSGLDPVYTSELVPELRCDCSRDRLERALISIGENDLTEMIEEDGEAELTCQFCGKRYHFDRTDLTMLLKEATQRGGIDEA